MGCTRNENAWRCLAKTCVGADERFSEQCTCLEITQQQYLHRLIAENAETRFGHKYNFRGIASYEDYAARLPIARYDEFASDIKSIVNGEKGLLTQGHPLFAEATGGSTSGAKIIPYTQGSLDDYWSAIRPWLADLLKRRGLKSGRIYFAVSPVGRKGNERVGMLPLGSPGRFAYFGSAARALAELSIAPAELATLADYDTWCFATCLHLLCARDLALIWVWSPTYLTELVRAIERLRQALLEAIEHGVKGPLLSPLAGVPLPARDPPRARELESLIDHANFDSRMVWPVLDTISCWMDASSAPFAAELQRLFPHVWFQPKGLMLTEGAVTVPFGEGEGSPLAVESGFFEFIDSEGSVHPSWNLELGVTYRVVLSNRGGLYRYDTGDLVTVVGFTAQAPRLVFKGRSGLVTDLCGEKLTEDFVLSCIRSASDGPAIFAILAPLLEPHPHYVLHVDGSLDRSRLESFAERLEMELRRNPQYAYARHLGQLSALEIRVVNRLFDRYREWATSKGRNLAGLKALSLLPGLPAALQALFNSEG